MPMNRQYRYSAVSLRTRRLLHPRVRPEVRFWLGVVGITTVAALSLWGTGKQASGYASATNLSRPTAKTEASKGSEPATETEPSPLLQVEPNYTILPPALRDSIKLPPLDRVSVAYDGRIASSSRLPSTKSRFAGKIAALTDKNEFVFYTIDPQLQEYVEGVVSKAKAQHVAIVVTQPGTGRVLAIAGKSPFIRDVAFHNGFPAASLFKVVTATAAVEQQGITPDQLIRFRGGTYTLERGNYKANPALDRRYMSIGEAMGRSCNPVFGRIALELLSPPILRNYARNFGFNADLQSDIPIAKSPAVIPFDDYEFSRTGAGFGDVRLSPVHAASMVGGIVNDGKMLRPIFIDKLVSPTGSVLYRSKTTVISSMMTPRTARSVLDMMEYTTTIGTSRREFTPNNRPVLPHVRIAAKTGTLSGDDPKGLNNWFIAAAPRDNAKVAIAVVVVNPRGAQGKASHLGKLVLTSFFE